MKRSSKLLILLISVIMLSGCNLPFQSEKYPSWSTKGVLEGYTLSNGKIVGGWLGAQIGDKVTANWYTFTVKKVEEVSNYENYKPQDGKKLIHAQIEINNTSDKDIYVFDGDFALVWDLDKEDKNYVYSLDPFTDTMLSNELIINKGETKVIDTVYEIDKNVKKPMAIYYYEQYNGQKGNEYYVYVK